MFTIQTYHDSMKRMITPYASLIRDVREGKGFSQAFMAEKLGFSRASYIAVEAGTRELTVDEAKAITTLLGIDFDVLTSAGATRPDYEKYKQMILEFLRIGADARGSKVPKTKLAKLLYLADFAWFYKHLESMSGMQYRRIQFGPVPDVYFRALDELFAEGKLNIEPSGEAFLISPAGSTPQTQSNLLSPDEKKLIANVADKWRGKRTQEIVDFTHNQLPYAICAPDEIIPYELITQEDPGYVY
jgi:transcriptional regulator with XRE-family HTH domain